MDQDGYIRCGGIVILATEEKASYARGIITVILEFDIRERDKGVA